MASFSHAFLQASLHSTNIVSAIHPGYGFLSENADFARLCASNGVIFIGPQPDSITSIGDKSSAKILLRSRAPDVPLIPGYDGPDQSVETLTRQAIAIGFPVLLKASAGGGGKGMRIVRHESCLREEIEMAKGESLRAFGSDVLLIEKYFEHVKHVEIQIMGDKYGNVFHCFERECSVQRRHQKVIEETPSPALNEDIRQKMTQSAVTIGKLLKYEGAGTVEFIFDTRDNRYYFLEVNTRLQVEHPITEAVTRLDLVELQILVASGVSLAGRGLDALCLKGHAIESRLYAEDPNNNFFPCTGKVLLWKQPFTQGSQYPRFDTGIQSGSEISVYYDPLISKITVWAPTRLEAIRNMQRALSQTVCLGLVTNKEFMLRVMEEEAFVSGGYTTRLIEGMKSLSLPTSPFVARQLMDENLKILESAPHRWYKSELSPLIAVSMEMEGAIVASVWWFHQRRQDRKGVWKSVGASWRSAGVRWRPSRMQFQMPIQKVKMGLEYVSLADSFETENLRFGFRFVVKEAGENALKAPEVISSWIEVSLAAVESTAAAGMLKLSISGLGRTYYVAQNAKIDQLNLSIHSSAWPRQLQTVLLDPRASTSVAEDPLSSYTSAMPCRVLKLLVADGATVKADTPLLTMESMKMETRMYSRHAGAVKYNVKEGQVVEAGVVMLEIR
eukprot:Partr_v1_DN27811_c1_g1_i2_m23136 putative carboxylase